MIGKEFLPVTLEECRERGWDRPDFVYVTGDAYVDHPSFGVAIISRVLEKAGFSFLKEEERMSFGVPTRWKVYDFSAEER